MFEVPDPADIFIDKSRDLLYSAPTKTECGRNSAVECHLAKVDVDGSNPFARSKKNGGIAKWLRQRSAKPLFTGSNPVAASRHTIGVAETIRTATLFILFEAENEWRPAGKMDSCRAVCGTCPMAGSGRDRDDRL